VLKSLLSISLCLILAASPLAAAPTDNQTANQAAGEVKGLIPDAWRNSQPVKVNDGLVWNDLLQTSDRGRLRAGLTDGSILSLGSNGAIRVLQHDAIAQQTSIDMSYGKLRNQVVKITRPDGKYVVKTPNAVIGVIGTDFYVGYENGLTTVICYVGSLSVTAVGDAKVVKKSDQAQSQQAQITLVAGQFVVIGAKIPPEGFPPDSDIIRASMEDTNVNPRPLIAHPRVWVPIVGVVAGGIAGGTYWATQGGSSSIPPPAVCGAAQRRSGQPPCKK